MLDYYIGDTIENCSLLRLEINLKQNSVISKAEQKIENLMEKRENAGSNLFYFSLNVLFYVIASQIL